MRSPSQPMLVNVVRRLGFFIGVVLLSLAGAQILFSKVGKFRERDRLLDSIPWRGDETVLDVGCGRGLLLVGVAKRLRTGRAVGVDIWQSKDQSGNHPEATYKNAQVEGVANRVEVKNGDARQLPFKDGTFDVVVSSLVLHNIRDASERKKAVQEIARVLKGGGAWPSSMSFTRTSTSRICARATCKRSQDRGCTSPTASHPCAW